MDRLTDRMGFPSSTGFERDGYGSNDCAVHGLRIVSNPFCAASSLDNDLALGATDS
jgi:hypothetical protein